MSAIHVNRPHGYCIGQVCARGCRRWITVTKRYAEPERALAAVALHMRGKVGRARVLFVDTGGWYDPNVLMEVRR